MSLVSVEEIHSMTFLIVMLRLLVLVFSVTFT